MGPYREYPANPPTGLDDAEFRQRFGYTREALYRAESHATFVAAQPQHMNCTVCLARMITEAEERGAARMKTGE